ncbi:pantoate--beta-alanine ligase [Spirochaetota bacterium]
MKTIETISEIKEAVKKLKSKNKQIGFVPTMGALHEGHLSLVRRSVSENDITVVSIFVNPTQFAPEEDLDRYPRTLKEDQAMLLQEKVDMLFYPQQNEIYTGDADTWVEIPSLGSILCGKSRPGHFKGVLTVVLKLFNIVSPDNAYFGKKDFQQYFLIKKMAQELSLDVNIVPCELIRDSDGIALSSRNKYLTEEERKSALLLSQALFTVRDLHHTGERSCAKLTQEMKKALLLEKKVKIDYIHIMDKRILSAQDTACEHSIALAAVFIGDVRLIDNIEFD